MIESMKSMIPTGTRHSEEKNRFPGAIHYVETFDTDDDDFEPADILSFETLREAFTTLQSTESELAKTIPEIELSAKKRPPTLEQPEYDIDSEPDETEAYRTDSSQNGEHLVAVDVRLEMVVEAILFVGNRENKPLPAEQIAEKLRNVSGEDVDQAIVTLNRAYQERNCPYTIIAERSGYRMVLRLEYETIRANFYGKMREVKLSQQAVDTLAVVAYRQPITADEIQKIRNQSCTSVLNQLVRRNLLHTQREMQEKKSTVFYHTTSRFLELLHIQSLDEIPPTEELSSV